MPSIYEGEVMLESSMDELKRQFHLPHDRLKKIVSKMMEEMEKGLSCQDPESSLKMLLSHVRALPSGEERGFYLALDLGGTNFQIFLIRINEGRPKVQLVREVYFMPDDALADGETFFDHIAGCMADFCKVNGLLGKHIKVGFTFSFPVRQECLNHAVLIKWNKDFNVSGVVGNNVVKMLSQAIERRGDMSCEVVAIVNDTVGTLVACAHEEPSCKIGLIVGNGSNACYMEKVTNLPRSWAPSGGQMCINMEWGGFGDNGVLNEFRNEYDRAVDTNSSDPGGNLYEKMICGKYLGELVRVVLCKFAERGVLFDGVVSEKLATVGSFKTSYVCEIERTDLNHSHGAYMAVRNILCSLGVDANDTACEVVRRICGMVSTRAAHLCASGLAAIALKVKANHPEQERMKISIAVDGTIYKKHPNFSRLLKEKVAELCNESGVTLNFVTSFNGSGKGAALVAATITSQASHVRRNTLNPNQLFIPSM